MSVYCRWTGLSELKAKTAMIKAEELARRRDRELGKEEDSDRGCGNGCVWGGMERGREDQV